MLKIGVMKGDDIGLEVVPETVKVMSDPRRVVARIGVVPDRAADEKLVMKPQQYDVVVTTNQFGDILTDEGAGLVGGLGLAPGLVVGERYAMAQATHGSAPDIAGQNIANPYAMTACSTNGWGGSATTSGRRRRRS